MKYQQGEEQSKLGQRQSEEAVELAMHGSWEEAVVVNQSIIDGTPGDVSAYNRLGKALLELGEISRAMEAYNSSLKMEPANVIALKNLARLRERLGVTGENSSDVTGELLQPASESMPEQPVVADEIMEKRSSEDDDEGASEEEGTLPEGFSSLD
jgi:Flp pilus assembly protein TadD